MSAYTLLERLRAHLNARNDRDLALTLGVNPSEVCRVVNGERTRDMKLTTLQRLSETTDIGIGQLAEWWAEPDGATALIAPPVVEKKIEVLAIDRLWHAHTRAGQQQEETI